MFSIFRQKFSGMFETYLQSFRNFSLLCLTNVCTIALNFHLPFFSDWKNVPLKILKFSQFLATQFSSKPLSRRIIHDRGSNLAARGNLEWLQLDVIGRCTLAQQEQPKEISRSLSCYIKSHKNSDQLSAVLKFHHNNIKIQS